MIDKLIVVLPGITGVLYFVTAIAFACRRQPPWALVYFAYALANVGLIWATLMEKP